MKVHVGNFKMGVIKTIIRGKCESINRKELGDVNGSEIKVLNKLPNNEVYICRIRGMTYAVDLDLNNPKVGIFDPISTGPQIRFRRGHQRLNEENNS